MKRVALAGCALITTLFVTDTLAADADRRVQKMLDSRKIHYEIDPSGDFKITYDVGGGRTQLAFVRSTILKYGALKVREILSIGYRAPNGDFPAPVANRLLDLNNQAKLGGWTKQGAMAIFSTKIAADADAKELTDAIEATVRLADQVEQEMMSGKDEF